MKKFYTLVTSHRGNNGIEIHLDGRAVKTSAKHTLIAPNQNIADALVKEWADQDETIKPDTMPITTILSTKIDRVTGKREALTPELMKFLNTDLVCYFTDHPPELLEKQQQSWTPWLNWFEETFGAPLLTTQGLIALTHPQAAHDNVLAHINALDDNHFTILQLAVPAAGSLVLGLAFTQGHIDAQALFNATRIEEQFQAEIYNEEKHGPDPAQEKKDKALIFDLESAENYLKLLK